MKVHEYLKTVEEQIRCKSIWEDIRTELLGHIEEDTEYFRRKGMSREEAVERAVEEMGDPVETGIELDKVHRTRLDVKLLLFFIGIDLLTVVLAIAYFKGEMPDDVSKYMLWRGGGKDRTGLRGYRAVFSAHVLFWRLQEGIFLQALSALASLFYNQCRIYDDKCLRRCGC